MKSLPQHALETSEGFMQALNELQAKLLQFTTADKLAELRGLFADVKTRACQLKGYISVVCLDAQVPGEETPTGPASTPAPLLVSPFPARPVRPPPPHIIEAANR